MKEFSHPGTEQKSAVNLNDAIESTVTVARNEWKYVADLETDFDPNLPLVPCLPGEFNQVILNLIINAAHAIADAVGKDSGTKGRITISTRRQGDWVEIRLVDTGTGIPEAVRGRIFDPFFTTKPVGKGTGQGLAIARSVIVDKHGGTLTFETRLGQGTAFIICLPVQPETDARQTPGVPLACRHAKSPLAHPGTPCKGRLQDKPSSEARPCLGRTPPFLRRQGTPCMKHHILFVDDEILVLQGLQRLLRSMRHEWEMDFVTSGAAALERMATKPVDVVVADMRMPGMNGAELLCEIMKRHPQTVRLILSGQADEELVMKCVGITHQYLSKPCEPEALKAAVNRVFSRLRPRRFHSIFTPAAGQAMMPRCKSGAERNPLPSRRIAEGKEV